MANRLGVWPTTVTHHAGGRRDGLIPLLIEHLAAGISTEPHGSWRTRLAELGGEIRRVALAHRGLADVLLRSGATGPQALRLADAILGALEDAGLDPDDAQDAYDVFLTYVLGSAGRQTTATAPARWHGFERALDQAEPDRYPALRHAPGRHDREATTRASPGASTSCSTPSPPGPRASCVQAGRRRRSSPQCDERCASGAGALADDLAGDAGVRR